MKVNDGYNMRRNYHQNTLQTCVCVFHLQKFKMLSYIASLFNDKEYWNFRHSWQSLGPQFDFCLFEGHQDLFVIVNTPYHVAHEICGEPSTEYSSRQPQCSAHGHRLREQMIQSPLHYCCVTFLPTIMHQTLTCGKALSLSTAISYLIFIFIS